MPDIESIIRKYEMYLDNISSLYTRQEEVSKALMHFKEFYASLPENVQQSEECLQAMKQIEEDFGNLKPGELTGRLSGYRNKLRRIRLNSGTLIGIARKNAIKQDTDMESLEEKISEKIELFPIPEYKILFQLERLKNYCKEKSIKETFPFWEKCGGNIERSGNPEGRGTQLLGLYKSFLNIVFIEMRSSPEAKMEEITRSSSKARELYEKFELLLEDTIKHYESIAE